MLACAARVTLVPPGSTSWEGQETCSNKGAVLGRHVSSMQGALQLVTT